MRTVQVAFNVNDDDSSIAALLATVLDGCWPPWESLTVDLSRCKFLGPSAVVTLCGLRRSFELREEALALRLPGHAKLAHYCVYAGLAADFAIGDSPQPHPDNVTTPLRVFKDSPPQAAIGEVVALAEQGIHLSSTARNDLTIALSEVTQNVLDHSRSPFGGVGVGPCVSRRT